MDADNYGGQGYLQLKDALNPKDHPATSMPNASEHHWGTTSTPRSDMASKQIGDRYGGADLPTAAKGTNEREFYDVREDK